MGYVRLPIDIDQSDVEDAIYTYIQTYFPSWLPREGHLAVVLSEAFAEQIADARRLATDVSDEIFQYFGSLVGITRTAADYATGTINITMIDTLGHTVPAGTAFRINISGDDYAFFETTADGTASPGSATASSVPIKAVETGSEANSLTAAPELVDVLDYVSSAALVGTTSGGADEEDIQVYLDRLTERLQLLTDTPVLPRDFEILANTVTGVERSLCLDLYDPANGLYTNEKTVTIVALDSAGAGVSAGIKTSITTLLQSLREVNFVVKTMDPTTTAVTVSATVRAYAGQDTVALKAGCEQAIKDYLDPSAWGQPGFGEERRWVKAGWDKVRYGEIFAILNNVEGVNYVETGITINGNLNTDLTLTGEAPIPAANPTVTITVNPA